MQHDMEEPCALDISANVAQDQSGFLGAQHHQCAITSVGRTVQPARNCRMR
jgi:hypothetical protein